MEKLEERRLWRVEVTNLPPTFGKTMEEAITFAKHRIALFGHTEQRGREALAAGRPGEWAYGFSTATITPPSGNLSERVRPESEAARWVCDEIRKLEIQLANASEPTRDGVFPIISLSKGDLDALGYDTSRLSADTLEMIARRMETGIMETINWIDLIDEAAEDFCEKKGGA